jgi:hypothetical protein
MEKGVSAENSMADIWFGDAARSISAVDEKSHRSQCDDLLCQETPTSKTAAAVKNLTAWSRVALEKLTKRGKCFV